MACYVVLLCLRSSPTVQSQHHTALALSCALPHFRVTVALAFSCALPCPRKLRLKSHPNPSCSMNSINGSEILVLTHEVECEGVYRMMYGRWIVSGEVY